MQVRLAKLTRPVKPTTAPVGTDCVISALHLLAERHGVPLTAHKLVARTPCAIRVSADDGPAAVTQQWTALLEQFCRRDTVLIFHMTNHYTPVYGAREWSCVGNKGDGVAGARTVRQVLVGKPGQKPCVWVDWQDVRACVLSWAGYAVLAVRRDATAAVP